MSTPLRLLAFAVLLAAAFAAAVLVGDATGPEPEPRRPAEERSAPVVRGADHGDREAP